MRAHIELGPPVNLMQPEGRLLMAQCACGRGISAERLAAIPGVSSCVVCAGSVTATRKAYMVYSHKTAPVIMYVDTRDREAVRIADRAHRRAR